MKRQVTSGEFEPFARLQLAAQQQAAVEVAAYIPDEAYWAPVGKKNFVPQGSGLCSGSWLLLLITEGPAQSSAIVNPTPTGWSSSPAIGDLERQDLLPSSWEPDI